MKCKGLIPSLKGKLINFDSPTQMQQEVGQSSQQPFSNFIQKKILPTMGSLYVGRL
jgi:hypothetical protein